MAALKIAFPGNITGKRFQPDDRAAFFRAFEQPDGSRWVLTLENEKKKRSNQQNRWYWGCVVKMIGDYIGSDAEETHELMKAKFNSEMVIVKVPYKYPKTGKIRMVKRRMRVPRSTTALSTQEFSDYCEAIRRWGAEFLALDIPDPVTAGY